MPKYKNYDRDDAKKSLKSADREKISEGGSQHVAIDVFAGRAKEISTKKTNKARKRLPIAVDIIIAILLLAIVAAVITGAYFALRYFTIDYDSVSIEYSILVEGDGVKQYEGLTGKHLYMDEDANTLYMGRVSDVKIYEADGAAVITVTLEAKYKAEEGYFADDCKIAVGKKLDVRTESLKISGKIVELERLSDAKRSAGVMTFQSFGGFLSKEGIS